MNVIEYHLFRVKVIAPPQISLFASEKTPREILYEAIKEKPKLPLQRNNIWNIGNLDFLDDLSGSFAIGRTAKQNQEKYDFESGNFVDEENELSPYTTVLFDLSIGLFAIAKKIKVSPTVENISKRLKEILLAAKTVKSGAFDVIIAAIPDPHDFIAKVENAYSIKTFKASFTGPNPYDADTLFQKPLSNYCRSIGGQKGTVDIYGNSLDPSAIIEVAKSTAATGNQARAKIQANSGDHLETISFSGDARKVYLPGEMTKVESISKIQEVYKSIRE